MEYNIKFGVYNFIFNVALQTVFAGVIVNVIVALLYNMSPSDSTFVYDVIRLIISTLVSIVITIFSVRESAKYACKREVAPEYDTMKLFAIVYFGILIVIQIVRTFMNCLKVLEIIKMAEVSSNVWRQEAIAQSIIMLALYIVVMALIVGCLVLMVPYTLYEYDRY